MQKPAQIYIWFVKNTKLVSESHLPIPATTNEHPEAPDYLGTLMNTCAKDPDRPIYFAYLGKTISADHKKALNQLQKSISNLSCIDFDELITKISHENQDLASKVVSIKKFYMSVLKKNNNGYNLINYVDMARIILTYYSDLLSQFSGKQRSKGSTLCTNFDMQCGKVLDENLFKRNNFLFAVLTREYEESPDEFVLDLELGTKIVASSHSRNPIFKEIINKIHSVIQSANDSCSKAPDIRNIIYDTIKGKHPATTIQSCGCYGRLSINNDGYTNLCNFFLEITRECFTDNNHHTWYENYATPVFYPSAEEVQKKLGEYFPTIESKPVEEGPSNNVNNINTGQVIVKVNRHCVIL